MLTNRPDSSIVRCCDNVVPLNAGIEVSVAATKSYTAQLAALYWLGLYLAEQKSSLDGRGVVGNETGFAAASGSNRRNFESQRRYSKTGAQTLQISQLCVYGPRH